jgi:hypothetical protein
MPSEKPCNFMSLLDYLETPTVDDNPTLRGFLVQSLDGHKHDAQFLV